MALMPSIKNDSGVKFLEGAVSWRNLNITFVVKGCPTYAKNIAANKLSNRIYYA